MNVDGPIPDRLDYLLPEFTRTSWVSEAARRTWGPRLRAIRACREVLEWRSVADGVRRCALLRATEPMLNATTHPWRHAGLNAELLPAVAPVASGYECATDLSGHGARPAFAIGARDHVGQLRQGVALRQHDEIGRLLGYPDCCRQFFARVRVGQQFVDPTWAIITSSEGCASEDGNAPVGARVTVRGPFATNIFWRQLGIRLVPHLPCRLDCAESRRLADAVFGVGMRHGYAQVMTWLKEVLSWPVEWSGLHGIAEIKTPIVRICTRTDATAAKYSARWTELGQAAEGRRVPLRMLEPSRPGSCEPAGPGPSRVTGPTL